jgi:hypothetical protein
MTQDEIETAGISHIVHVRKHPKARKPLITGEEMSKSIHDIHDGMWLPPRDSPTRYEIKQMVTLAMRQMTVYMFRNHIYEFNHELRHQSQGGAIGVEFTVVAAQSMMIVWNKKATTKLEENGIVSRLDKLYVDDETRVVAMAPPGYKYNVALDKLEYDKNQFETDLTVNGDVRMAVLIQSIVNTVSPHIQVTYDVPSLNENLRLPVLDVEMWMETTEEGRYHLNYSFYKKPISTNKLILATSAVPDKMKIMTNVCHVIRRLFNTSLTVPWVDKCKILDKFD